MNRTIYVQYANPETRALGNAALALELRATELNVAIEAARRLEALEMAQGKALCMAVSRGRTTFEKLPPLNLRLGASNAPLHLERLEVVGLEPGESCAIDRFGEVLILYRPASRGEGETP